MQNANLVRASPNRKNIYFTKSQRPPTKYSKESYVKIITPIAKKLKSLKKLYPMTIIYLKLQYCGFAYQLVSSILGDDLYIKSPFTVSNCLIAQFHASQTAPMKLEIIQEMGRENSTIRIVFATSALGMGVNIPQVSEIIHILPPSSMEEFIQEVGRAGRTGGDAKSHLFYNNSDIANNDSRMAS